MKELRNRRAKREFSARLLPSCGNSSLIRPSEVAMVVPARAQYSRTCFLFLAVIPVLLMFAGFASHVRSQQQPAQDQHQGHEGMNMPMDEPSDPAAQAKLQAKNLADKKESEFNHHLAGLLVAVAGVFMLFQGALTSRWPAVKFVWPACFLLAGVFVLVWSDTELWPFGHRQWLEALQNNREVLQHKTFAVLLLGLGAIEWQRARGVLKAAWSAWIFPAIAIVGSIILIFHQHEGGMVGEHHMETMARIQSEHLSYTVIGLGIGLAKGLGEMKNRSGAILGKIWPALMILLGILLMFYRE
jgi:copper resistance protein D